METYNYTTHSKRIPGDMHTPVSLYLKLRDLYPQSVLMESSDYHAGENSRSFIALCPLASIAINRGTATVTLPDGAREEHTLPDHPEAVTDALRDFMNRFHVSGDDRRVCGLYGYTTFNAVRYFERIPVRESREERNDAPDIYYILYRYVIVINPFRSELRLGELRADGEESGLPALEAAIDNRNYATYAFARRGPAVSTLTDDEPMVVTEEPAARSLLERTSLAGRSEGEDSPVIVISEPPLKSMPGVSPTVARRVAEPRTMTTAMRYQILRLPTKAMDVLAE